MERFFLEVQLPPPVTYFDFDLQRFDTIEVGSSDDIADKISNASAGDTIKLTGDISVSSTITIDKNLTLDLNGQTLSVSPTSEAGITGANPTASGAIHINDNVDFTVTDSGTSGTNGTINYTPASSSTAKSYAAIEIGTIYRGQYVVSSDSSKTKVFTSESDKNAAITAGTYPAQSNATFNMLGGKITGTGSGIVAGDASTINISGGTIESSGSRCGVFFGNQGNGGSTLTMTGGTIKATGDEPAIQVSGNLDVGATTLNISGGTVEYATTNEASSSDANNQAIYAGGITNLNISGNAEIKSNRVAIEIRAGQLEVSGGTITSNSPTANSEGIICKANGIGATTSNGVAISIAQHTSKKNITANISGGTISGYAALLVNNRTNVTSKFNDTVSGSAGGSGNKQGEQQSDGTWTVGTVSVSITGGTLESNSTATENTASVSGDSYIIKGKNAIINLDSRATKDYFNISEATIKGALAVLTNGRTAGEDGKFDYGYTLGEGNTYSNFSGDTSNLFPYYYATESGTNVIDLAILGTEGWNKSVIDNNWAYVIEPEDTASIGTALAQLVADSVNAVFSLTSGGNTESKIMAFDATSNMFNDLSYKDGETTKYYTKIDANQVNANTSFDFTGNDRITEIKGGAGNDTLKPGDVESITLGGGSGADVFIFNGNNETITDFGTGADSINMPSSFRPANAEFTAANDKISLDFDGNVLAFENLGENEVSLSGGHVFATRYHAIDKQSITFTTVQSGDYDASSTEYETIDAGLAGASIAITGNDKDNRIIGSNRGGTLNGGAGNDKIFVTDRDTNAKYRFEHTAGKDVVDGFDDANDTLSVELTDTTEAKGSSSKLTLTFGKNDNIALKSDAGIEKVILPDNRYLTDSGYFGSNEYEFKLFQNAKGKIDFTDAPYKGTGIQTIDATNSKKKSVTLTADANVTTVKLADNKKKDQFNYGGGTVSITGYEAGKDKLNIADVGAVSLFSVDENGVSINAGGSDVISIQGAKDKEVLILDGGKGSSYSKFVFHDTGVLYNKAKRPTEANIYSNVVTTKTVDGEETTVTMPVTVDSSIKKVFLQEGVAGVSIQSSNNKTTLDASAAGMADGGAISLIGGAKNNRFVGSDYGDMFVYKGGKDAVTNFQVGGEVGDSISFDTGTYKIEDAKISLSKKSLKFKFSGKNALDLKSDGAVSSLSFGNQSYTFAKNAYSTQSGTASLTSAFSGSYNLSKSKDYSTVDGSRVKKNLTFKGTDGAEVLTGGTKKTNFKGGGGADSLVGGSGKDTFFYAKGDSGTSTIANFDFGTDKLKIANGTIQTITKAEDSISFEMSSGGKNGSFQLTSYRNGEGKQTALAKAQTDKVAFKVNNTHYWFAQSDVKDGNTTLAKQGELITWDKKVTARDVAGLNVIDLGYSTNLAKTGLAVKVSSTATGATLPSSSGSNSN